jgi:hypothetical protein
MAKQHGKVTVVKLDGDDLSQYSDGSDLKFTADSHDTTTYGKNSHVFSGGLKNGSATVTGFYDTTAATGPRAVIQPLVGTVVPFIHQPEGTGSSLPQDAVDVLVTEYSQSHPVADMVKWSVSLQFSDDVVSTAQSA